MQIPDIFNKYIIVKWYPLNLCLMKYKTMIEIARIKQLKKGRNLSHY